MRTLIAIFAAGMLMACAGDMERDERREVAAIDMTQLEEPVESVYMPFIDDWAPVSREHVILFQSPSKGYLIELERPVTSPFFEDLTIGVRETNSRLTTFDYLLIDGWRHSIESIRPLTRGPRPSPETRLPRVRRAAMIGP